MTLLFIADSAQRFNVPLDELHAQHPGKRLVVGVAITAPMVAITQDFSDPNKSQAKKLLLLQRAETENVYPLMYELPGGGAEPQDTSLLATVVRETAEETGLSVTRILGIFPGFEYETSKSKAIQFKFLVEVDRAPDTTINVHLNPQEHCTFAWVDEADDLSLYPMTEAMHQVVLDALSSMAEQTASVHYSD
ncbi:NUDIX hydrolase domain-like protein [Gymnopilus junonius]|uniref:NUDIX hydrolase domain-like protein n=1 Tax=Gymnopilus junonius TaxID=109634 RepID=A0A9P5NRT9_GYMJU|nr:NUDIX hydrolase domain-like protein [Gymnopilus junonius]